MNWDNYGSYWEVDHVIPCNSFDIEDNNQQLECFNWKNCRPLEKSLNNKKNDKIIPFVILKQELKVYSFIKYATHLEAGKPLEPLLPPLV